MKITNTTATKNGALSSATARASHQPMREETKQWLALRKEAGLKIDPKTCELIWIFAYDCDPYGLCDPAELEASSFYVGREYFARSPESDGWVHYTDLPDATVKVLREKRGAEWPPSFYANTDKEGRITFFSTIFQRTKKCTEQRKETNT